MNNNFFSLLIVILSVSGCAVSSDMATQVESKFRVAVFGDSISAGINAEINIQRPSSGWVDYWMDYPLSSDLSPVSIFGEGAGVRNFSWQGTRIPQWIPDEALEPVLAYQPPTHCCHDRRQ